MMQLRCFYARAGRAGTPAQDAARFFQQSPDVYRSVHEIYIYFEKSIDKCAALVYYISRRRARHIQAMRRTPGA